MTNKQNGPFTESAPPLRDLSQLLAEFGIQSSSAPGKPSAEHSKEDAPPHKESTAPAAGITSWLPKRHVPEAARGDTQLVALFDRVEALLGAPSSSQDEPWFPRSPERLEDTGLSASDIERLILKFLLARGSSTGRGVAQQVRLSFGIVDPILRALKYDQLLSFVGTAEMGDYEYAITEMGRERARRYVEECTYYGAAPVGLRDYLKAMETQSIGQQQVTETDLKEAFADLLIGPDLLECLGPAINSGRGMFLFGSPGNGKTSIAERITKCFGSTIWIPRALGIDGDLIRLYDPGIHEEVPVEAGEGLFDLSGVDPRWIRIVRPTVIAGGELTMEESADQGLRSSAATEEQLRHSGDRRLRPPADARQRTAQSLDRSARKTLRLSQPSQRKENPGSVRSTDHLLDKPGTARSCRWSIPETYSLQDPGSRSDRGRVPRDHQAAGPTHGVPGRRSGGRSSD
jgi:DNA-binding PadR family transcriptional regulator